MGICLLEVVTYKKVFVSVPLEIQVVKREHFNKWYELRAYYWALTIVNMPIQVCFQ